MLQGPVWRRTKKRDHRSVAAQYSMLVLGLALLQAVRGLVVVRIVGAEMVEKEEWIEVIQTSRRDYATKLHACAVRCRFRLYDALNFSWCGSHINILAR